MSDRLNEAIDEAVGFYDGVEDAMPEAFQALVAATRGLVNGERVEARKQLLDGRFRWLVEVPGPGDWLLIDPPKEEE